MTTSQHVAMWTATVIMVIRMLVSVWGLLSSDKNNNTTEKRIGTAAGLVLEGWIAVTFAGMLL